MAKKNKMSELACEYEISEEMLAGVYYWTDEDISLNDVARIIRNLHVRREETRHTIDVKKSDIFGSIDKTIATLTELKAKGYTSLFEEWAGYETNYLVAAVTESETDEEYYRRFARKVNKAYEKEMEEKAKKTAKKKKIKQLEKELAELKIKK